MPTPNIFSRSESDAIIERLYKLNPETQAQWGKMNVAQMLAHCNVTYEMVYETKHPKPKGFMKFILKMLVKNKVVSKTPYPKNNQTAAAFIISGEREFTAEKTRLAAYILKTQALGAAHFDGKESHSFGPLNEEQWNNLFYKHLNHHLSQFGV